jgi:hypothetical protein
MDPTTIIAGAKATWEAGKAAYAGWSWYEKWRMGEINIDRPKNNQPVPPGGPAFEGRHKDAKGTYWLVGVRGDQYWPKTRVNLKPDGTWNQWVGIGDHPGPRESVIGLFWVDDFMDAVLTDVKWRSDELKKWDPITFRPPRKNMKLVQGIVLNVQ